MLPFFTHARATAVPGPGFPACASRSVSVAIAAGRALRQVVNSMVFEAASAQSGTDDLPAAVARAAIIDGWRGQRGVSGRGSPGVSLKDDAPLASTVTRMSPPRISSAGSSARAGSNANDGTFDDWGRVSGGCDVSPHPM